MPSPHLPEFINADDIIPTKDVVRSEDEKDQQARRWAGVIILGIVAVLCLVVICIRPDSSQSSKMLGTSSLR